MPQISLKISKNVAIHCMHFQEMFVAIHNELHQIAKVDIKSCNSGVIHEAYSYIGIGDQRRTKVYLEVLWLENAERVLIKKEVGKRLMEILETKLVPQIEAQQLLCIPRVRIGNLGVIDEDYYISQRMPVSPS
jgi:hypothetical protein